MTRTEIIFELSKYAHPSWYHSLLTWGTGQLSRLLDYYKNPDQYFIGVDYGIPGPTMMLEVTTSSADTTEIRIKHFDCPICEDEGVVPSDEWDPDSGRYMAGVGEMACECRLED